MQPARGPRRASRAITTFMDFQGRLGHRHFLVRVAHLRAVRPSLIGPGIPTSRPTLFDCTHSGLQPVDQSHGKSVASLAVFDPRGSRIPFRFTSTNSADRLQLVREGCAFREGLRRFETRVVDSGLLPILRISSCCISISSVSVKLRVLGADPLRLAQRPWFALILTLCLLNSRAFALLR